MLRRRVLTTASVAAGIAITGLLFFAMATFIESGMYAPDESEIANERLVLSLAELFGCDDTVDGILDHILDSRDCETDEDCAAP